MTAVYIAVKEDLYTFTYRRRTARAPAVPLNQQYQSAMAEDHGRNVAVIQMLIRLVINRRSERRRPAATATGVSSTDPCYRPPRKYLQCWCFDIYRDDIAFFVGFNASGFEVDVVMAGSRPIAQIRQSTVSLRPSSAPASGYHRHFSLPLSGWRWVQLRAFGVHHFNQRFRDHRVKLRSGACLRTNRCVFAPRP